MGSVVAPVLTLALALAQGGGLAPSEPTQVRFPVVARDTKDRVVSTLSPEDFEVTDRGAALRVLDARFVPAASDPAGSLGSGEVDSGPQDTAVPESGARVFAFFLDEYHVAPADTGRVRQILSDFLRRHTTPRDWLLVVKPLDPLLALSPQRGPSAALEAVASFEGRLGDYTPRSTFERDLIAADPVRIDRARARIATSTVQAVVTRLAQLGPPRKAFLVVGQEFEPVRAVGRIGDALPTVDAIVRAAERGNVAISTLDPRVMPPAPPVDPALQPPPRIKHAASRRPGADVQDAGSAAVTVAPAGTLFSELVRLTDGRTMREPTDRDLSALAADLGDYYLLTFSGADDGQYHPVEVRMARSGLRARARPGYWAPSAEALARSVRDVSTIRTAPTPPALRSSRLIVPWFGQERVDAGRTRVTFVWDAAPTRAGDRNRGLPPSRVVVHARASDGTAVFDGTVQALSSGMGTTSVATFEAPPGRVRLQMSIQDASARELDTDVREVVVSAFTGSVSLGTPRVFRARTAREFNRLARDLAAAPSAARTFARTERLLFHIPFHVTSAVAAPVVSASLVNRAGQVMRVLQTRRTDDAPFVTTDLPLAALAAGEYSVQWHASTGQGEVRETVSFRVTP